MRTCIYCSEEKPLEQFNREHVVPESCGRFRNALVAHELVCEACNSHFGRTLDLILARGTDEGLQRYHFGVKPQQEVERFRYDALSIHYQGPGDLHGALLALEADPSAPSGFRATPIDQVGIARTDGDGFQWMPLAEFYDGSWKDREDLHPGKGVRIYAKDHEGVRAYLEREGVELPNWRQMDHDGGAEAEVLVQRVSKITTDVERALAKIAFNYLAVTNGAAFALLAVFDPIRRFVRFGETNPDGFVHVDTEDIIRIPLPPGTPEGMTAVVHIVTVEYSLHETSVIGQVSLFGGLRYVVCHAGHRVDGLTRSGHLFNVSDLSVTRLGNRHDMD